MPKTNWNCASVVLFLQYESPGLSMLSARCKNLLPSIMLGGNSAVYPIWKWATDIACRIKVGTSFISLNVIFFTVYCLYVICFIGFLVLWSQNQATNKAKRKRKLEERKISSLASNPTWTCGTVSTIIIMNVIMIYMISISSMIKDMKVISIIIPYCCSSILNWIWFFNSALCKYVSIERWDSLLLV